MDFACILADRQIFHGLYRFCENFNQQKKPPAALLTIIWMRSDVDMSVPPAQGFRVTKTWFWRWALAGFGAMAVLVWLELPIWLLGVVLLAWFMAGLLSFQHDAVRRFTQMTDAIAARSPAIPVVSERLPASNWVSGWYWESDTQGGWEVFQAGQIDWSEIHVDAAALSAHLTQRVKWLALWSPEQQTGSAWERLCWAFDQQQAPDAPLELPWPQRLAGLSPQSAGRHCLLRLALRHDASGRWLGWCGTLTLAPTSPAPAPAMASDPAPDAVSGSTPASAPEDDPSAHVQMTAAEQEALRYALSHDLRAPLRVVEGFTRIVKEDYGRALDRMGMDHLDRVLSAATRMHGMIDAILAQAQLAGAALQRAPIDLSDMAREVAAEQALSMPAGVTVDVCISEGLQVQADPVLVRRVLDNLIGNACKYSAKVAQPRVEMGVMPATNPAVFFIRDNGAGFDMAHADKLFGMFQRLHSAKEFPGTGVGLAGVQQIVRRHGGRIWAEAQPGAGACFYFTLMDAQTAQHLCDAAGA